MQPIATPQRDLRLAIEGVTAWVRGLSGSERPAGWYGLLEGEEGDGQGEVLRTLWRFGREHGLLTAFARGGDGFAPGHGVIGSLGAQLLGQLPRGSAGKLQGVSSGIASELDRLGLSGEHPFAAARAPTLTGALQRDRLVDGFSRLLFEAGAVRPVLLLIERLHDCDMLTRAVLQRIGRLWAARRHQAHAPRFLVLGSLPEGAGIPVDALGFESRPAEECFRLRMKGLSRDDLRDTVEKLFGDPGTLGAREDLLAITGGNVCRSLWALRSLSSSGVKSLTQEALQGLQRTMDDWIGVSLSALDEAALQLLTCLADGCEGWRESSLRSLSLASETPGSGGEGASAWCHLLRSLEAAGWIDCVPLGGAPPDQEIRLGGRYLAEPIRRLTSSRVKAMARNKLKAALSSGGGLTLERASGRLEVARSEGDCALLVEALREAGEALRETGCGPEALELLEQAASTLPRGTAPGYPSLLRLHSRLLEEAGYAREALDRIESLLALGLTGDARVEALLAAASLAGQSGEQEIERLRREEAHALVARSPATRLQTLERLHAAQAALARDDLDAARAALKGWSENAAREGLVDWDVEGLGLGLESDLHRAAGQMEEALQFENRIVEASRTRGPRRVQEEFKALGQVAWISHRLGRPAEAEQAIKDRLRIARWSGSRSLVADAVLGLAKYRKASGEKARALRCYQHGARLCLDLGRQSELRDALASEAAIQLELGLFESLPLTLSRIFEQAPLGSALQSSRRASAAQSLERWMGGLPRTESRGEALRQRLDALLLAGRTREATAQVDQLAERSRQMGDSHGLCLALELGEQLKFLAGDFDGALARLQQLLDLSADRAGAHFTSWAFEETSRIFVERGDYAKALSLLHRGVERSLASGLGEVLLGSAGALVDFLLAVGAKSAALKIAEMADAFARAANDPALDASSARNLGGALVMEAKVASGGALIRRWERSIDKAGRLEDRVRLQLYKGWHAFSNYRFREAMTETRAGAELAARAGFELLQDRLLRLLGVIESSSSNPSKNFLRAIDVLEKALARAERRRCLRLKWEILGDIARVYDDRGKHDAAYELLGRAAQIEALAFAGLPPALRRGQWRRWEGSGPPRQGLLEVVGDR